ncbi:MAG TPA: hypothetical protein VF721_04040 [Pyrinomonadaceae bacterium]|jgi:hypothetical protein
MLITLTTPTAASVNGDYEFQLKLQSNLMTGQMQSGIWEISIRNSGVSDVRVDIWSEVPSGFREAEFLAPFNESDMKTGKTGCAKT